MPSESGVTSSRSTSLTSPLSTPPWIAAPTATTSSGLTPLCGSLPISSLTFSCDRQRNSLNSSHPPISTLFPSPTLFRSALEHPALNRGADGDDLVRVDSLVRILADQLLDLLL